MNHEPRAVVTVVRTVEPHPNADKLDILTLVLPCDDHDRGLHQLEELRVVTGKHYRKEQLGIFIPAGLTIPGWMAEDMWLFGRATAMRQRFEVRTIDLRGVPSVGLFCGSVYRKVKDDLRSVERFEKLRSEGGLAGTMYEAGESSEFIAWPFWRPWWKPGDDVTAYLGLTVTETLSAVEDAQRRRHLGAG